MNPDCERIMTGPKKDDNPTPRASGERNEDEKFRRSSLSSLSTYIHITLPNFKIVRGDSEFIELTYISHLFYFFFYFYFF
jgi:hypothetical protein